MEECFGYYVTFPQPAGPITNCAKRILYVYYEIVRQNVVCHTANINNDKPHMAVMQSNRERSEVGFRPTLSVAHFQIERCSFSN